MNESCQTNLRLPVEFEQLWASVADLRCQSKVELFRDVLMDRAWSELQLAVGRGVVAINEINAVDARAGEADGPARWNVLYQGYADLFRQIFKRCPDYRMRTDAESATLTRNFIGNIHAASRETVPAVDVG